MGHNFQTEAATQPQRCWLITTPRTASNLLVKMLNLEEQDIRQSRMGGYFFMGAMFRKYGLLFGKGAMSSWTDEEKAELDALYDQTLETLQKHIEASEREGKAIFVKEHAVFLNDPRIDSQWVYPDTPPASPGRTSPPPVTDANDDNKNNEHPRHDEAYDPDAHERLSTRSIMGITRGTRSRNNMTVLPDEFLHTLTPTFLIRHPAVMIPSNHRAAMDTDKLGPLRRGTGGGISGLDATMRWVRKLYDFYDEYYSANPPGGEEQRQQQQQQQQQQEQQEQSNLRGRPPPPPPIILDADDIMNSAGTLVPKYAAMVGLDPSKVRLTWQKHPAPATAGGGGEADGGDKYNPLERRMLDTILGSSSVDKSKMAGDIDIDVEAAKWRDEFGEEWGRKLERWVREAMPDYEYMRARRVRP